MTRYAECHGPATAPDEALPTSLAGALARAAADAPDHGVVIVRDDGESVRLSYPQLREQAAVVASALADAGCGAGQAVVLYGLGLADFFPAFWGCVLGGFVPLPISFGPEPRSRAASLSKLRHVCAIVSPALVLTDSSGVTALAGTLGPDGPTVVDLASAHEAREQVSNPVPEPSDIALMLQSSGSTGKPKVIPLTHAALLDFAHGNLQVLGWRHFEPTLNWLPVDASAPLLLYHLLPVFAGADNLHVAAEQVLADPLRWLDLIARYQVRHTWAPTFGYRLLTSALADSPSREWDLRCIKTLVSGGEQISAEVVDDFLAATAGYGISGECFVPAWGMTETVTGISWGRYSAPGSVRRLLTRSLSGQVEGADENTAGNEPTTMVVTSGSPAPRASLRIVDERTEVVAESVVGVLQVRSIRNTPGYLGDDEASALAFTPASDGGIPWLNTGDLAFMEHGQIFLVGRVKDVVIVNGENHPCYPIEKAAESIAGVTAGMVVACGVPDLESGTEALAVFFVPETADKDTTLVAREVAAAVARSAGISPRYVLPIQAQDLPRTAGGKIQRAELARKMAPRLSRSPGLAEITARLRQKVTEITGAIPVDETPFFELGLTSVTLARLHRSLGYAELPRSALFEYPSIETLAAYLHGGPHDSRVEQPAVKKAGTEVAVIGMAFRFPGASTADEYWENLRSGRDCLERGGLLDDADCFDAGFFGMSPKEAALTHPGHRIFLECAYHALETAGYAGRPGVRVGVYAGEGSNLVRYQSAGPEPGLDLADSMLAALGTEADFLSSRVSYRLGLSGPAVGIKTACSSSLVAVHLAIQALREGDADLALAGAAAVQVPARSGYVYHRESVLSASRVCRPFDAEADGTVAADGVAVVLLKPLGAALADGDDVMAVITGTAVNNDGARKAGFSAPSVQGQVEVVREALRRAGITGSDLQYVEAHGTGTPVGDPVEFGALDEALGRGNGQPGSCAVGSVKASIGHLDSCSGMAGLIKVVLMLRHRMIVPTVHLRTPNPALRLAGSPLTLATGLAPMPDVRPLRVGVNSLGVGGTNAFAVVQEAPQREPVAGALDLGLVRLSGRRSSGLRAVARSLGDWLQTHPEVRVADVAASMAARPALPVRAAVTASSVGDLAARLAELAAQDGDPGLPQAVPQVAFAYSGQGSASGGMERELYGIFPVARSVLDECEEWHRADGGQGLLRSLVDGQPLGTALAQPAQFALQAALTTQWRAWGVVPDVVLGHSLGELAALHAAGALSLGDGIRFAAARGRLMETGMPEGGLVAVRADLALVERVARQSGTQLTSRNGASQYVLAGSVRAVVRCGDILDAAGVPWRRLGVDRAFHSTMVDAVLPQLAEAAARCVLQPLRTPLIAAQDGTEYPVGTVLEAEYLVTHARRPVRFDLALAGLDRTGVGRVVEIGPKADLAASGRRVLPDLSWPPHTDAEPAEAAMRVLADLANSGHELDWDAITSHGRRRALPGYPFERIAMTSDGPGADQVRLVLHTVGGLVSEALGVAPPGLDHDRSFIDLGGDSLTLMALTRLVDRAFGVSIPIRMLFDETNTPRRLARAIATRLPVSEDATPAQSESRQPAQGPAEVVAAPPVAAPSFTAPSVAAPFGNLFSEQLSVVQELVGKVTDLMARQLDVIRERPAAPVAAETVAAVSQRGQQVAAEVSQVVTAAPAQAKPQSSAVLAENALCDYSLYFFGDYPDQDVAAKFAPILEAAEFADTHGFHSLWFPERHFASFGGIFPNPSVLASALAVRTERIRLNAGSVVLPLHDPIRVAEEWSVVDNLSGGRAGLCAASGWHANDFVLAPDSYSSRRELTYERVGTIRELWAGGMIRRISGSGGELEVGLFPRPLQKRLPMYVAVVGNPESYRQAALNDLGVVTNLMTQSIADLAANIALYQRTRAEHNLDPGRVVVLMHTYLGADAQRARSEASGPFRDYLRASLNLLDGLARSLGLEAEMKDAKAADLDFLLDRAFDRYCAERALIGSPDSCVAIADAVTAAGADEIACFVDFGVPARSMIAALPWIADLQRRQTTPAAATPAAATPATAIEPVPQMEPASAAQRRMWLLDQMYPGRSDYHEPKGIVLDGPVDVAKLRRALDQVVVRHPALRVVFRETDGELSRIIQPPGPVPCPLVEMPACSVEEALAEFMRTAGDLTLSVSAGPLFAARLARLADDRHVLFVIAHHIIFDSLSTRIFCRDLAAFYRAWPPAPGSLPELPPELPPSSAPADLAASVKFWRAELAGAALLALPSDGGAAAGRSLVYDFGADAAHITTRLARELGASPFMVLLAALSTTLGRFSGQDDFLLGVAVTNRPPGAEDRVGMYIDTVALRMDLTGGIGFDELVRRVRNRSTRAYEHLDVPFDDLVTMLNPERVPGANPLFSVMVEFGLETAVEFDPPAVTVTLVDVPSERAPLDLSVYLTLHDEGLRCVLEYESSQCSESMLRGILGYVKETLRRASDDVRAPLSQLTALTADDRATLAAWQGTRTDRPLLCLHHLVEHQVRRTPESPAIISRELTLSYQELDEAANALAYELASQGIGRGDVVAIFLPPSAALVTAVLAVLKAGAAYLPIDISIPDERIAFCLGDSGVKLVLAGAEPVPPAGPWAVQLVEVGAGKGGRAAPPGVETSPSEPAYCIYTSGSTGKPKAVQVPHRGPVNLVLWQIARHRAMRTLQWTSIGFDVSVQEIFGTLASGAALVVPTRSERLDPAALSEVMSQHEVERLHIAYTPLKYLADYGLDVPSLREICVAGEQLVITPAIRRLLDAHPEARLYNQYGPTEGSVVVTSQLVEDQEEARVPIGSPIDNVLVHVMDATGEPVPVGAVGELWLAGSCLATGYLGDQAQTELRFAGGGPGREGRAYRTGDLVRWRPEGVLEFIGRLDNQVKIRGHRVEPGETQWALACQPGVRDVAVIACEQPVADADPQLAAYVVTEPWLGEDWSQPLRDRLRAMLPSYLVPDLWIRVDELPVGPSGKLQLELLPPAVASASSESALTAEESILEQIWCAELGQRSIQAEASFFDVGGNSLKAVRILALIRERFGIQVPFAAFAREPTIRAVARELDNPAAP